MTEKNGLEKAIKAKNVLEKAVEAWNILTLTDQTHIESARAWFIEGYVHGYEDKNTKEETK